MTDETGEESDSKSEESTKTADHTGEPQPFVPPTDGSYIPRERLNAVLDDNKTLKTRIGELETAKNAPKVWTKSELDNAVLDGDMAQEQADAIVERQIEDRVTAKLTNTFAQSSKAERQAAEIASYEEALPDLAQQGSDLYNRVMAEYKYLVEELGQDDNNGTIAAAVRSVAGPLSAINATGKLKQVVESHQETGGGAGKKETRRDKLTPRQRDHYDKMIRGGAYKDWDAVHEELDNYAKTA